MISLTREDPVDGLGLRRALCCAAALCIVLAIAGFILAQRFGFQALVAVPVVAAFSWQGTLYCLAVSNGARNEIRRCLPPRWLAAALVVVSVLPYAIYAIPTGVFSWESLLKLALLCSFVAWPFVLFPGGRHRLTWPDVWVTCVLAFPMISGLSTFFRDIYVGFEPPANRLDALGKLMLIPLGLYVFLVFRRLQSTGFRLVPSRADWKHALENSGYALPWLVLVGITTGYLQWDPPLDSPLADLAGALGKLVGIYFTTALAEEFLLRGVVQNLTAASTGRPLLARTIASLMFGAVHLGRGQFPNLGNAATSAVLGWFCGRAYDRAGTVTAAMVAHALAVAGQELFFR